MRWFPEVLRGPVDDQGRHTTLIVSGRGPQLTAPGMDLVLKDSAAGAPKPAAERFLQPVVLSDSFAYSIEGVDVDVSGLRRRGNR